MPNVNQGRFQVITVAQQGPEGAQGIQGEKGDTGSSAYGAIYYFTAQNSEIPGYEVLDIVPYGNAPVDETAIVNSGTGEVLIDQYATTPNVPNVTSISAGSWLFNFWRYVSHTGGTTEIVFRVYIRDIGGIETELFNVSSGEINDTILTAQSLEYFTTTTMPVNETDRIVIKVYAKTTHNPNVTVHLYHDDGYAMHCHTPIAVVGEKGDPGQDGVDGNTILYGAVDPTTEGVDGNFYINTSTSFFFGPKAAGVWPAGTSLMGQKGDTGDVGPAGNDGNTILYGAADPTTEGVDGNFYINTSTSFFFGPKAAGVWPAGTSLIGPPGTTTWAGITDKPTEFPPEAHVHPISEVTNLQTTLDGKNNITGFPTDAVGDYLTTLVYNETTRTVTVSPTGADFKVFVRGVEFTKTAQSLTHTTTQGGHFFYYDETGTLVVAQTPWNLLCHAPLCYVFWDATNSRAIPFDERHHAGRDLFWHRNQHTLEGTKISSGFASSGYTLNSGTTDAAVTFSISTGRVEDEDIRVDTEVLPDGGPYTIIERSGAAGDWRISLANSFPFLVSGNNVQYNQNTGATWQRTNVAEDQFVNFYVCVLTALPSASITPTPTTSRQFIIIPGQVTYATQALATAETFSSLALGSFPFQEIAVLNQVTVRFNASNPGAYSNTPRAAIVALSRVVGSVASITAAAQSHHGSLTGLEDDDHLQYSLADGSRGPVNPLFSRTGTLAVASGVARWYPTRDVAMATFEAWVGAAPTGADIIASVKKNGVQQFTVTIAAGSNTASGAGAFSLLTTDYVTIDITQVGSTVAGSDLNVRLKGS